MPDLCQSRVFTKERLWTRLYCSEMAGYPPRRQSRWPPSSIRPRDPLQYVDLPRAGQTRWLMAGIRFLMNASRPSKQGQQIHVGNEVVRLFILSILFILSRFRQDE